MFLVWVSMSSTLKMPLENGRVGVASIESWVDVVHGRVDVSD